MPIEFRCPSCSKLLRTPDESAGKKAKCPQCASVVEVPRASAASDPLDLGSLGPLDPLGPIPPSGPGAKPASGSPFGSSNPYASPTIGGGAGVGYVPPVYGGPHRSGLPWDRGPRSLKKYWETVKVVFKTPSEAFGQMSRTGGLGIPLGFAMIGGLIGAVFTGIYNTIMQLAVGGFVAAAGGDVPPGVAEGTTLQAILALPIALVVGTVGVAVGLFINSGINHLFLMLVGGAKQPFETTFRVVAYVQGTVLLLQAVPVCGGWVSAIVALVFSILGFAAAHQITAGRAAAAVLLQVGLCIGAVILLVILGFAAVAAGAAAAAGN